MTAKKDLPCVLYRYDLDADREAFLSTFHNDFEVLACRTDAEGGRIISDHGERLVAIILEQDNIRSPLSALCRAASTRSLSILIHQDIGLDSVVSLLDGGEIDRCFSKSYDSNIIRSEIYASFIGFDPRQHSGQAVRHIETDYSILIVDDEVAATKFLKKRLEKLACRYDILLADSAERALEIFADKKDSINSKASAIFSFSVIWSLTTNIILRIAENSFLIICD